MADAQDRNLPASARKIQRARGEGQVPRSRDLGHFLAMAAAAALMFAAMPSAVDWMQHLMADGLRFDRAAVLSPAVAGQRAEGLFVRGLFVILPVGALLMSAGVGANLGLGGWNFTTKALHPNFGRLNPVAGLGRLFNKGHLVGTLKAMVLAIAVGSVGTLYLKAHFADLGGVLAIELPRGLATVGNTLGNGFLGMLGVLALSALIDVPWQRKQFLDRLKMSKQERKQEHKDIEGNSEVKAKIRQKMRELARRRMMQAVPQADIVVMNPTHYAVALKYDERLLGAPRVVAKGTDRLALRIRDLAADSGVPVLQAPPLARALYTHVELDAEVPAQLFAAVAQVLAWVYQLRRAPQAALRAPDVSVPPELDPANGGAPRARRRRGLPASTDR
jgi:flagellar biosynthetic protein FlhB